MNGQRGVWTFGPIIGFVIVVLAIIGLFAVCTDGDDNGVDTWAPAEVAGHDYDCWDDCYDDGGGYHHDYGGRHDNQRRNRGAFSPGPFQDSPVDLRNACISLDCSGRNRPDDRDEPAS